MVEIIGAAYSNVVARPSQRGFSKAIASNSVRGTALFSFEGMNLDTTRFAHAGFVPSDAIGNDERSCPLIFENCIEKNFHVPNMKSGPCEEHGCNFKDPYSTTCELAIVSMSVFKK